MQPSIAIGIPVLFLWFGLLNGTLAGRRLWRAWKTGQFDGPPIASRSERQGLYRQRVFWNVGFFGVSVLFLIVGAEMLTSYFLHRP